jgi:hypothetical protein
MEPKDLLDSFLNGKFQVIQILDWINSTSNTEVISISLFHHSTKQKETGIESPLDVLITFSSRDFINFILSYVKKQIQYFVILGPADNRYEKQNSLRSSATISSQQTTFSSESLQNIPQITKVQLLAELYGQLILHRTITISPELKILIQIISGESHQISETESENGERLLENETACVYFACQVLHYIQPLLLCMGFTIPLLLSQNQR